MNKQVDQLLQDQKVRPSNSPYPHPIVCVAKPNGEVRLCTDMRYINSGTVNDAYPMPNAEELLMRVCTGNYISLLDNTAGFWQIPMRESDVYKTAFVTSKGYLNG